MVLYYFINLFLRTCVFLAAERTIGRKKKKSAASYSYLTPSRENALSCVLHSFRLPYCLLRWVLQQSSIVSFPVSLPSSAQRSPHGLHASVGFINAFTFPQQASPPPSTGSGGGGGGRRSWTSAEARASSCRPAAESGKARSREDRCRGERWRRESTREGSRSKELCSLLNGPIKILWLWKGGHVASWDAREHGTEFVW